MSGDGGGGGGGPYAPFIIMSHWLQRIYLFFYWVCLNTTFSTIVKKSSNIGLVLVFGHIFIDENQNTWQAEVGMNNGFYKIV